MPQKPRKGPRKARRQGGGLRAYFRRNLGGTLTAAKFKQRQLIATYAEVKRAQDEWEKELSAWEKTGPPLLKSDEGKKLATDAALVKRFRVLIDLDRPTRDALADARTQAEDLITPVREA